MWLSPTLCPTQILARGAERERRQAFHGEVHGQLPFDLIGMQDGVPSINIPLSGGRDTDSPYTLERSDIKGMCRLHVDRGSVV